MDKTKPLGIMMKKKIIKSWKYKVVKVKDLGHEPPLNKDGYWKKFKPQEFKVNTDDGR
jgi:hypothetical protein